MRRNRKLTLKIIVKGLRRRIGDIFFKKLFLLWQSLGFHLTRNHYYEPIPDTRTLKDELWQKKSALVGIDMNEVEQVELLSEFSFLYKKEYDSLPSSRLEVSRPYEYFIENDSFKSVDGEILYCMIRHFNPKRIIEVGSGYTTYLSAKAILKNRTGNNNFCELIAIEPYPNDVLRTGFPGLSKLVTQEIQDVPISEFTSLKENDILFIDSSHVLKIGSDVQYEYLEILPRLNKGVIVHIHDIFLPTEYLKEWVISDYCFWNEQYILHAFLLFNDSFEVIWAGHYMHLKYSSALETAFKSYRKEKVAPGSFWIKKTK